MQLKISKYRSNKEKPQRSLRSAKCAVTKLEEDHDLKLKNTDLSLSRCSLLYLQNHSYI